MFRWRSVRAIRGGYRYLHNCQKLLSKVAELMSSISLRRSNRKQEMCPRITKTSSKSKNTRYLDNNKFLKEAINWSNKLNPLPWQGAESIALFIKHSVFFATRSTRNDFGKKQWDFWANSNWSQHIRRRKKQNDL